MAELMDRVKQGDLRALSRALTLAENSDAALLAALDAAWGALPQPWRIGITGPPGAGKSTLVSALVRLLRERGAIGVVAVDPTSPYSGGALLGDRLRMTEHALDPGVFVRSMASRGQFGGLAAGCEDACDLLALAGFGPLVIETVGVGQSEVEIAGFADTTLVVLTPGAGDSVQALKAGIMEVADIVVINKADRPGADRLEEEVKEAQDLRRPSDWTPPIVRTVATEAKGLEQLLVALDSHSAWLAQADRLRAARARRASARLRELVVEALARRVATGPEWSALVAQVAAGTLSPRAAVALLVR